MRWFTLVMASVIASCCLAVPATAQQVDDAANARGLSSLGENRSLEDVVAELIRNGDVIPTGVTGACCTCDGSDDCIEVDQAVCDFFGGQFQGDGTTCATVDCDDVLLGACCLDETLVCPDMDMDGIGDLVTRTVCVAMGGVFRGGCTTCLEENFANPCPVRGACCLPDGTCANEMTFVECDLMGGIYQGYEERDFDQGGVTVDCSQVQCTGACCLADGSVVPTSESDCLDQGGDFQGYGQAAGACRRIEQVRHFSFQPSDSGEIVTLSTPPTYPPIGSDVIDGFGVNGFREFDSKGGVRALNSVTIEVEGRVVNVTFVRNISKNPILGTFTTNLVNLNISSNRFPPRPLLETPLAALNVGAGEIAPATCGLLTPTQFCVFPSQVFPNDFVPPLDPNAGFAQRMTMAPADLAAYTGTDVFAVDVESLIEVTFTSGVFEGGNTTRSEGLVRLVYGFDVLGACCLCDGTCQVLSEADCAAIGGVYQGDEVPCSEVDCVPFGACCLCDGDCQITTAAECAALGGMYQGDCTVCEGEGAVVCEPYGACCLCDGTCTPDLTAAECAAAGGVYQGDCTTCDQVDCPVLGACCLCDGTCIDGVTQTQCDDEGGVFTPSVDPDNCVTCADVEPCPVLGACCLCDGTCVDGVTLAECDAQGGKFTPSENGVCVDCTDVECVPFGACCLCDGMCLTDVTAAECLAEGGIYQGDCSECGICPPFGACCFCDGSCTVTTQIDCETNGGVYQGDCTVCNDVVCDVIGACCLCDGSCVDGVTEAECTAQGGLFYPSTDPANCVVCDDVEPCPILGVCCLCNGVCLDAISEADCLAQGGKFTAPTNPDDCIDCSDVVCEPFGVCCLLDGTCIDTGANGAITEAECLAQGGCFAECVPSCDDDGTGNPVVCDLGACCFGEDCVELPQLCCEQDGGVFKGVGVPCTPNPCVINCRGACERKGSLLIFSKVDVRYDQAGNVVQDTFIQITNDYIENVRVQMYFVNGDDPVFDAGGNLVEPGWNSLDNEIELTKDQTFAWSAATGSGLVSPWSVLDPGSPPGRPADDGTGENMLRGFILAWAVNADNEEIRFNHLAGTGTLLRYNEYGRAWEYTACAFNVPSSVAPHGAALGSPGTLFLDGSEYCAPGDLLVQTFQAVGSNAYSNNMVSVVSDTDVTLHPVDTDLRQNAPDAGPVATKAEYTVWNENENKFSGAFRCVYCWDQTLLSDYGAPNHFTIAALQTNFGKFRIDGIEGEQCDVELPNGQFLTARKAAMIGLRAQMMFFGGGDAVPDTAASGVNMRWAGLEPAIIRYQVLDVPPPEAPAGPAGARNPFEAAEMLFDDILEEIEAMRRDEARRGTVN